MNRVIAYNTILFSIDVTYDLVDKWIKIACRYFEPQCMTINRAGTRKYSEKKMYENINEKFRMGFS